MIEPVKVTDVSLRDGLEGFVLKHLRLDDLTRLGSMLDRAGFYSIDCCGGAAFYAALTELKEDPWQRLRRLRRALSGTPIQMILRGRSLVGFKPYDDEVVRRFMTQAAHLGVDIFRVYDTLNDLDNMALAIRTGKELRKQVEGTVLYSLNPHVTIDDYLELMGGLANLGADVLCLNDSFGIMNPAQVAALVSAYRRYFHQPLRLHLHDNHRAAITSYQEGIRLGVELVDTTLAGLSWSYGPPPVESLMFSLGGSPHDPHLEMDILGEVAEYLEFLKEKYQYQQPLPRKMDDRLGPSYLPGPLKEFIREELKRRDARDRQQVAYKEAQAVWGDLGYPPLKGRILEIVGLQAVENIIISGRRYESLIPSMVDLLRGRFGRLHSPVKLDLQWLALSLEEPAKEAYPPGGAQLRTRPGLEREEDVLLYSLFPEEAEAFFYFRSQSAPLSPAAPAPQALSPYPILTPFTTTNLILNHKGEEVRARLEGVGSLRKDKQVLFINIQDHLEEIEVQLLPGTAERPEFLVTFHGDTYRIRINQDLRKHQEYTPVLLEINGAPEEFLLKESPGDEY